MFRAGGNSSPSIGDRPGSPPWPRVPIVLLPGEFVQEVALELRELQTARTLDKRDELSSHLPKHPRWELGRCWVDGEGVLSVPEPHTAAAARDTPAIAAIISFRAATEP